MYDILAPLEWDKWLSDDDLKNKSTEEDEKSTTAIIDDKKDPDEDEVECISKNDNEHQSVESDRDESKPMISVVDDDINLNLEESEMSLKMTTDSGIEEEDDVMSLEKRLETAAEMMANLMKGPAKTIDNDGTTADGQAYIENRKRIETAAEMMASIMKSSPSNKNEKLVSDDKKELNTSDDDSADIFVLYDNLSMSSTPEASSGPMMPTSADIRRMRSIVPVSPPSLNFDQDIVPNVSKVTTFLIL